MAEPPTGDNTGVKKDDKTTLSIPADIVERFGDLIELIKNSRSMDDSERQYWIDVLPIMSEDQIQNLRDILDNEKKQLEEAEAAYAKGVKENFLETAKTFDAEVYKEKKEARIKAEAVQEAEETKMEESILEEIKSL